MVPYELDSKDRTSRSPWGTAHDHTQSHLGCHGFVSDSTSMGESIRFLIAYMPGALMDTPAGLAQCHIDRLPA